jgi:hypothetical protein
MAIFTKEQFLAFELSSILNDKKHFGFYCVLAKKYPAGFLIKILNDCQENPNWQKIKNRGAYFTTFLFNFLKKIK